MQHQRSFGLIGHHVVDCSLISILPNFKYHHADHEAAITSSNFANRRSLVMYTASIVLIAAFLLMLAEGKLVESAWLKRRMDEQARLRIDGIASGLLLATMGGACVALNIGAWMAGEYQGVRLGTVTRADHPFWFWTIAAIFFPSSIAVVGWGLLEFVRALKQAKK